MIALPEVDAEKCTGCGECAELCPTGAVDMVKERAVIVRPQECSYCAECEKVCPFDAIRCPFEILLVTGSDISSPEGPGE